MATAVLLYFFITGCYVFFYVPVVVGSPIRLITRFFIQGFWRIFVAILRCAKRNRPQNRMRRTDLVELLAVLTLILCLVNINESCQQVEVFSHSSTVCEKFDEGEICRAHVSEVLQVNPFKKEACFRLLRGNASVHEFRVTWQTLALFCEPETIMFTRDTTHRVVDNKRCPHMGSCVGRKCEDVNSTSMLPELEEGNKYPGNTACVESCGGPGCDCFYLSSGCLFYRIYVVPESPKVYEIYKCNRWNEAAKVKFTHTDITQGKTQSYTAFMSPNVPVIWKSFTATLSSITVPPLPLLNSFFITDNTSTALWDSKLIPALQCQDKDSAENLDCEVRDKCILTLLRSMQTAGVRN